MFSHQSQQSTLFWNGMTHTLAEVYRRFGRTFCLHARDWRVWTLLEACRFLVFCSCLAIRSYQPTFLPDYTALYSRREYTLRRKAITCIWEVPGLILVPYTGFLNRVCRASSKSVQASLRNTLQYYSDSLPPYPSDVIIPRHSRFRLYVT
jgi:hypothetical protein